MATASKQAKQAQARSDVFAALAVAFKFPTAALAESLASGEFAKSMLASLRTAGAPQAAVAPALAALAGFKGEDAADLLARMKDGYSALYLAPGTAAPAWPFEGRFRSMQSMRSVATGQLQSPVTLDVERQMRAQGVLPAGAGTEPADSIWGECSFLAYLYRMLAEQLASGRPAEAAKAGGAAQHFASSHLSTWGPAFAARTRALAPNRRGGDPYAKLSYVADAAFSLLPPAK